MDSDCSCCCWCCCCCFGYRILCVQWSKPQREIKFETSIHSGRSIDFCYIIASLKLKQTYTFFTVQLLAFKLSNPKFYFLFTFLFDFSRNRFFLLPHPFSDHFLLFAKQRKERKIFILISFEIGMLCGRSVCFFFHSCTCVSCNRIFREIYQSN